MKRVVTLQSHRFSMHLRQICLFNSDTVSLSMPHFVTRMNRYSIFVTTNGGFWDFVPAKWHFHLVPTVSGVWVFGGEAQHTRWGVSGDEAARCNLVSRITGTCARVTSLLRPRQKIILQSSAAFYGIFMAFPSDMCALTDPIQKLTSPFIGWDVGKFDLNVNPPSRTNMIYFSF